MWTKRSAPPLSLWIKPNPLSSLKNFTVPCTFVCSMIFDARVAPLILTWLPEQHSYRFGRGRGNGTLPGPRQFASTAEDVEIKRERGIDPSGWSVMESRCLVPAAADLQKRENATPKI